jgi:hypothetical protein
LLQQGERAAAVKGLAALFTGIAFLEGICIADDPSLLLRCLLHGSGSFGDRDASEARLLGCKAPCEGRWSHGLERRRKRALRQAVAQKRNKRSTHAHTPTCERLLSTAEEIAQGL